MNVYAEFAETLMAGMSPEQVIDLAPSAAAQDRLDSLIYKLKTSELTTEEDQELQQFKEMEHLIRMAKARARRHVQNQ